MTNKNTMPPCSEATSQPTSQRRRDVLLGGLASGAALAAAGLAFSKTAQAACGLKTPAQPKGPFYPVTPRLALDADLVHVPGSPVPARGEVIVLTVRVVDDTCKPIVNAKVDLWQACASGKYDHPDDPNDAALDPAFQYQAVLKTNEGGETRIRTIKPGAYPNDPSWTRPPHIHFTVEAAGFQTLTTQMYFAGEALNANDLILRRHTPVERDALTVAFQRPDDASPDAVPEGTFQVVLRRV